MLSDRGIRALVSQGKLIVEGFQEENLTPNGYDLTIGHVESEGQEVSDIPAKTAFLVGTVEVVDIPIDMVGHLWLRSGWARKGVLASFGVVDAGFRGNLTFGAFNGSSQPLEVPLGKTFAQIVFHPLEDAAERSYEERSGNYQDQRGVTRSAE